MATPAPSPETSSAAATTPTAPSHDELRRKLSRVMLRTVVSDHLIEEGDRILVAISGGKDSYTMLDLLWAARRKAPVKFDILAFHLDQQQPGYDNHRMVEWLEAFGAPYRIHSEDTYSVVKDQVAGTSKSYCAPCSRLRRGILYTWAEKLECNKIALGHHREDALETLLLNLFYSGKLESMPSKYRTNDDRFDVIRPLIECSEAIIAAQSREAQYPILPCNLCGSQIGLKRVRMRKLIESLEGEIPDVRSVMLGALKNVRASHLLDREVAEAWNHQAHRYQPRK